MKRKRKFLKKQKYVFNINNFEPKKDLKILVDTNILVYLFPPYELRDTFSLFDDYTSFIEKMLSQNVELFITELNFLEYEKIMLKEYYRDFSDNYKNFKKFRDSDKLAEFYKNSLINEIENIKNFFKIIKAEFNENILDEYLSVIKTKNLMLDFVDFLLVKTAIKRKMFLLTHDIDFIKLKDIYPNLRILSGNKNYFI